MRNWLPAFPIVVGLAISAGVYGNLPTAVVPDWSRVLLLGGGGEPMPRLAFLLFIPAVAIAVWVLLAALARVTGRRTVDVSFLNERTGASAITRFEPTFVTVITAVVGLLMLLHVALIASAAGWPEWVMRAVGVVLGAGTAIVGNLMPRVRPNWIVGIRTRATLRDSGLWLRTHRYFGMLLMMTGIGVAILSLFASHLAFPATFIGLLAAAVLSHGYAGRGAKLGATAIGISVLLCGSASACSTSTGPDAGPAAQTVAEFETQLDRLRAQLGIPGMSAIVMIHDTVVWEGSLGVADIASQRPVTPATQFHLASLTKTFASTIVLQLVEQGLVNLDDPISKFGLTLPSTGVIRVRHLLTHTSEGVPGDQFRYNGDRFALLDQVIDRATGESFATRVNEHIITPLALEQTAPNPLNPDAFATSRRDAAAYIAAMASGYGIDSRMRPVPVAYPTSFSSAAGLVSTARDVARYSTALDAGHFLSATMRTLAYTPSRDSRNAVLPYGLGWFVSTVSGHTLVWHYGYWTGNSSLIIKEPSRGLTFVVLTNSDQLSAPFRLGAGDLMSSTVAQTFVNAFVTGSLAGSRSSP